MEEARVQTINDEAVIEVTKTVTTKTQHTEAELLRRRAYFESLVTKGTDGIAEVDALLSQINNERSKL